MPAFEGTLTSQLLKAHVSGNHNLIPDCTQMLVPCLSMIDRLTKEILYRPMQIANMVFSKAQPTEKISNPLRVYLDKGSGPIWKPIKANILHSLSYVFATSPNLLDHNADHNVPGIAIISETEI